MIYSFCVYSRGLTDLSAVIDWISFFWNDNCRTPVLGLGLGVDFTFAWDNKDNNNNDNYINKNIPHLNFLKGTVQVDKDKGVGIQDKPLKGLLPVSGIPLL